MEHARLSTSLESEKGENFPIILMNSAKSYKDFINSFDTNALPNKKSFNSLQCDFVQCLQMQIHVGEP